MREVSSTDLQCTVNIVDCSVVRIALGGGEQRQGCDDGDTDDVDDDVRIAPAGGGVWEESQGRNSKHPLHCTVHAALCTALYCTASSMLVHWILGQIAVMTFWQKERCSKIKYEKKIQRWRIFIEDYLCMILRKFQCWENLYWWIGIGNSQYEMCLLHNFKASCYFEIVRQIFLRQEPKSLGHHNTLRYSKWKRLKCL